MNKIFLFLLILAVLSRSVAFAEIDELATERAKKFAAGNEPISSMNNIEFPEDRGRIPEATLRLVWDSHRDELLKGATNMEQFMALSFFCELVEKSPDGEKLLPDLVKVIAELGVPAVKLEDIHNSDERVIQSNGGKLGVLMRCVLQVAGGNGFNQLFDRFHANKETAKIGILLQRVPTLPVLEKDGYLNIVTARLNNETDAEVKELLLNCLKDLKGISKQTGK